jgi:hypothetical protein
MLSKQKGSFMSQNSLYSISEEFSVLMESVVESGGEIEEDTEKSLASVQLALNEKADNVVQWVNSKEDLISLADAKIKQLSDFKKSVNSKLEKFDRYVDNCLRAMSTNKIDGSLYSIKRRKPSMVVVIHDETEIPMDFIKIPEPVPSIMRAEIGKALKAGTNVPGASLEESKTISITYSTK